MANHHHSWQIPSTCLIFHSHVGLPEGTRNLSLPKTTARVETRQVSECVQLFMNLDITERKAIAAEVGF